MRTLCSSLLLLLLITGCSKKSEPPASTASQSPAVTGSATIKGVVHFSGRAPEPQPLDASQDPNCAGGLKSESLIADEGRLQNVYIYVKQGAPEGSYQVPTVPATLDQRGCRYMPHVLGIMVGQKLEIRNSDPTMHNVHPSAKINEGWNLSQGENAQPAVTSFDKPELMMPVQCNVHPWMKMYLHVSQHPFFAVSRHDGTYEVGWLPPGTYTIAALHEKLGEKTRQVTITTKGETVDLDFNFSTAELK